MNNSAVDPFIKQLSSNINGDDDFVYEQQFKDFLLRYYIGISDFRGKGTLVDCGLPTKIEKYLSLHGKILVVEMADKLYLARLTGKLKRNFRDKSIRRCDFILLDDDSQEIYQIRTTSEKKDKNDNEIKKLVVYDGSGKVDLTIDPSKIVLFINNDDSLPDQIGIEFWTERLKSKLDLIEYDSKKCKKKMALFTYSKMDGTDKAEAIEEFENNDFLFNIHWGNSIKSKGKKTGIDPSETNFKLVGPEDSKERAQLWQDYREYIIEVCKFHGVIFQISFKSERQNIPETLMAGTPYKAWEKERKRVREEVYKKCEELGWIEKGWELNYGAQAETNEQKIQKLEEELKLAELEGKLEQIRSKKKEAKKEE